MMISKGIIDYPYGINHADPWLFIVENYCGKELFKKVIFSASFAFYNLFCEVLLTCLRLFRLSLILAPKSYYRYVTRRSTL